MEISQALADEFAEQLVELTGNTCYFCKSSVNRRQLRSVDFVVPLSKGGALTVDNAILCCKDCSARRRRRHMADYVSARLAELTLEVERLKALEQALLAAKLTPSERNAAKELASAAEPEVLSAEEEAARTAAILAAWEAEDEDTSPPKPEAVQVPRAPIPPHLDPEHPDFDPVAYNAWLDAD